MTYSVTLGNKNYAESIEVIEESNKLYLKKNKSKKFSKKIKLIKPNQNLVYLYPTKAKEIS